MCPGRSDPFYILSYYIKWVTTSRTHSIIDPSLIQKYNQAGVIITTQKRNVKELFLCGFFDNFLRQKKLNFYPVYNKAGAIITTQKRTFFV